MKKMIASSLFLLLTAQAFASSGSSYSARSSKWSKTGCMFNNLLIAGSMGWLVNTKGESGYITMKVVTDPTQADFFYYIGTESQGLPHDQCGDLWLTSASNNANLRLHQMTQTDGYDVIGM